MRIITREQKGEIDKLIYDPEELKKCEKDPLYFHNKYVKDPDIPDRTQEEFQKWMKEVFDHRLQRRADTIRQTPIAVHDTFINKEQYKKLYE